MKKIFLVLITGLLLFLPVKSDTNINSIYEGNKTAKIEIIVFESLTCSHCASFHTQIYPKLKKDFIDKEIVKIIFKSFPLDLAALNASKIAHCNNDGNSKILHLLYKKQNDWIKGEKIEDFNLFHRLATEDHLQLAPHIYSLQDLNNRCHDCNNLCFSYLIDPSLKK